MANRVELDVIADVRNATAGLRGVSQQVGGLRQAVKSGAGAFKGFLGATAVVKGAELVKRGIGTVITEAGNLEQSVGAIDAVFGKSAGEMQAFGKTAATSVGLTRNEFGELATTLGASLKNAGIKDFAGETQGVIKLGADLAAQFGGSTAEAVSAVGSLMRGEADPIERYGVSINQTAVNAELAAKGQDKLKGAALRQAQAQARLRLLFQQTADAQGAFNREGNTWAHVAQVGKAVALDYAAKIGNVLLPYLTTIGQWMLAKLPAAADAVQAGFQRVKAALAPLQPILEAVIGFIKNNPETVKAFAITLGVLAVAVGVVSAATAAWNAILAANPIGLIIVAIAALVAGVVYAYNHFETFRKVVNTVWAAIKKATKIAWELIKKYVITPVKDLPKNLRIIGDRIIRFLSAAWNKVKSDATRAWQLVQRYVITPVRDLPANLRAIAMRIGSFLIAAWNKIKSDASRAWQLVQRYVITPVRDLPRNLRIIAMRIGSFLIAAWNKIKSDASRAWQLVQRYVLGPIRSLPSNVRAIANRVRSALSSAWNAARNATVNMWRGIVSAVRSRINDVVNKVRSIRSKVWSATRNAGQWLRTAGRNLVTGFINGITGSIGAVIDRARRIARAAINAVKNTLGIRSPSRVFRGLGEYVTEGLALGLDDRAIGREAVRLADALTGGFGRPKLAADLTADMAEVTRQRNAATGGNTYHLTVEVAPNVAPADVGREIVRYLRAFEDATGRQVVSA